ncbi:MAG TPA: amidohydrolase family protein [Casimicrobiaceae bacterium]|nr:amidohydrolase family protein [Casimicrobiaceae bacterium]
MIIDCRCRLTVAGAADYFVDRVTLAGKMAGVPALAERTHAAFFAELDGAGVTTAVSVSGYNPGAKLGRFDLPARTTPNDLMAEVQRAHPGRFVGVAGIDASNAMHDAMTELARSVDELGLFVVFIEPGRAPGCNLDDPRLYPIYEFCAARRLTLIPQTSGLLGGTLVDYANPKYIERVAEDFPELNIICGHGCYPYVREAIVMASRRRNVWLAPDSYVFHLGRDDWLHAVNHNLLGFADRFLFASAYPLNALKPQLDRFRALGWKEEVLPKLLWRNAVDALRLRERGAFASSAEWAGHLA